MSEKTQITASFVFTFDELKTAVLLQPFQLYLPGILIFIMSLSIPAVMALMNGYPVSIIISSLYYVVPFLVVVILFSLYSQKATSKKVFSQTPWANRHIEYNFSKDEIVERVEGISETKFPWTNIRRVKRTKKGFIFYRSQSYFWVPEHAFQSREEANTAAEFAHQSVQNYSEI